MEASRQIYDELPSTIEIPAELRRRRAEVIILTLEPELPTVSMDKLDENGWPVGYFDIFGSVPDFPAREPQGEYDVRDLIE